MRDFVPHIYHEALHVDPRNSIANEIYKYLLDFCWHDFYIITSLYLAPFPSKDSLPTMRYFPIEYEYNNYYRPQLIQLFFSI